MTIALPGLPGLGDAVQPTPYATPQAQAAQRDYAKALMYGTVGKDGAQFPVVQSWTQGVSNMVNALMGGLAARDADTKDQAAIHNTNVASEPKTSFNEGPSSEGREKTADASGSDSSQPRGYRNNNPLNIESGSFTQGQPGYVGSDGRFAKFDTMDHGTAAASSLLDSYGKRGLDTVAGIVGRWAPASDGNNVSSYAMDVAKRMGVDPNQPLQPEQRQQLIAAMAQHENGRPLPSSGGTPMAFSGPDGGSSANPAVAAMSAALQGKPNPQIAQNGVQPVGARSLAPPSNLPQPNGSGMYYDPRLIKAPPQYTAEQMDAVMNNPALPAETKAGMLQQFRQQGQPIELPYPGGHVLIDPRNPTRQQFIPDLQKGTTKLGDVETPSYGVVGPSGAAPNIQSYPIQRAPAPVGPQSSAAPTAAPAVAPQAAPVPAVPPGPVTAQNAPAAPVAPPSAPIQVASNDPAAAFAAAAGKPPLSPIEQQMMAMAKPGQPVTGLGPAATPVPPQEAKPEVIPAAATEVAAGPKATIPPNTPLTKLAANDDAIRNLVGGDVYDAYKQKKDADVQRTLGEDAAKAKIDVDKEAQNDSNKFATKKYDTLSTQGQAARKLMPNIDMALALTNDPRFHSGILAGPQDVVSRLKAGLFGDDKANAPNEVFDKLMAGTVLDTMKTALSGLGQVRLAEIGLLTKANANRTNSPASNRAVLEVSRRGIQSIDHLDDLGQQYASGDEVRDPVDGKVLLPANVGKDGEVTPRHGLDVGFDKLARKFVLDHPAFTPEETKHYETIFDTGKDPSVPEETASSAPKVGETKEFDAPGGGKVTGVWDGKAWGPKK